MTIKSEEQGTAFRSLTVTPAQAEVQWRPPTTEATGYQPSLV
ncbi:MAG TPA: hypothetical protein VGO76_04075 [Luteibacter sp.]|jgi:hypothetical protein|nr:hypothetical protein [Luteibacter sp.]